MNWCSGGALGTLCAKLCTETCAEAATSEGSFLVALTLDVCFEAIALKGCFSVGVLRCNRSVAGFGRYLVVAASSNSGVHCAASVTSASMLRSAKGF